MKSNDFSVIFDHSPLHEYVLQWLDEIVTVGELVIFYIKSVPHFDVAFQPNTITNGEVYFLFIEEVVVGFETFSLPHFIVRKWLYR